MLLKGKNGKLINEVEIYGKIQRILRMQLMDSAFLVHHLLDY